MSLGKTLLIGAAGLAAGLLIAAWAETMDNESDESAELDLDDDTDLEGSDETVEAETDESLKEQSAAN
jgi:hypothetical protein